jgi:hypothetical protein
MTIHVTQSHIDAGVPGDFWACAVALALQESTGRPWFINGTAVPCYTEEYEYGLEYLVEVILPKNAQNFCKAFDKGEPVDPFSFELEIP